MLRLLLNKHSKIKKNNVCNKIKILYQQNAGMSFALFQDSVYFLLNKKIHVAGDVNTYSKTRRTKFLQPAILYTPELRQCRLVHLSGSMSYNNENSHEKWRKCISGTGSLRGQAQVRPIDKLDEACTNADDQMMLVQHCSGDRVMS